MFTLTLGQEDLTLSIIEFFNLPEDSYLELEIEVTYSIFGSFRQATFYEPAEYPELDTINTKVIAIYDDGAKLEVTKYQLEYCNILVNEMFEHKTWKDRLETACWEDAEKERIRYQEDLGEYLDYGNYNV